MNKSKALKAAKVICFYSTLAALITLGGGLESLAIATIWIFYLLVLLGSLAAYSEKAVEIRAAFLKGEPSILLRIVHVSLILYVAYTEHVVTAVAMLVIWGFMLMTTSFLEKEHEAND